MDTRAHRSGDRFIVENDLIRRIFLWNDGNLISLGLERATDPGLSFALSPQGGPDLVLPGESADARGGELEVREVAQSKAVEAHLEAVVSFRLGELEVRRAFRVFDGVPAIESRYAFKGRARESSWIGSTPSELETRTPAARSLLERSPQLDRLPLPGRHSRLTAVELVDVTDRNNNLVRSWETLPYRQRVAMSASILLCRDTLGDSGLFVVKEAPLSGAQLAWPGADFSAAVDDIRVWGIGLEPADLEAEVWQECYGDTVGIARGGELELLMALKSHLATKRRMLPGRDHMVLLNTWGDRGQDKRIGEPFALQELEAGRRLGVSHFQLDDGWQKGRSTNSATSGGTLQRIWDIPGYWDLHPERFPRGLGTVAARARKLGVELCIWFNPSADDGYAHWRDDASVLVRLHREHGIRTFKIDGVVIPTRKAERNFLALLDTVVRETDGEAVFNLDVTAGRRLGYLYANRYGNLFLENRYTDWSNYYPHWTLRNLWQLARWLQPQSFQIEFLNRWRNPDRYAADDPLAPSRVPFDYCFAVTMAAQPLAWFEASGLPEEAFAIGKVIAAYRRHQGAIHAGVILPIGEEPSGSAWTGFQSIGSRGGYLLVYREKTARRSARIKLWGLEGKKISAKAVAGHGEGFDAALSRSGWSSHWRRSRRQHPEDLLLWSPEWLRNGLRSDDYRQPVGNRKR